MWLGRGDYDAEKLARGAAAGGRRTESRTLTDYLVGTPLLGDYLEEGALCPGALTRGF